FVFFSSRRRHTRSKRDWSSDVCSSDLTVGKRVWFVWLSLPGRSCNAWRSMTRWRKSSTQLLFLIPARSSGTRKMTSATMTFSPLLPSIGLHGVLISRSRVSHRESASYRGYCAHTRVEQSFHHGGYDCVARAIWGVLPRGRRADFRAQGRGAHAQIPRRLSKPPPIRAE